ncbi:MAG: hypothetical protein HFH06_14275 [Lachnospiraceae bacterium]|nr:hypothetical protein [Lachnospiraceae bacterium]
MTTNDSTTILNTKLRDSNSKIIFDEPILCAQFLRDYIEDIPLLKNVRPEDIVDVSEQYVHLFSEERNSDRVKKVHIKNGTPFFLVSLIEHKTKVEYNVTMQIFRYMIYIWEAYEREEEKQKKGISKQKGFRYPPILPIVYYEGRQEWTVPLDFKSRIIEGDTFAKYVPDFRYYLVPLRKYSDRELLDREDEISLIMLINKLQEMNDISSFRSLPKEQLDAILKDTPDHIVDIIADMLLAFLLKSNVSANEAEKVVGKVKEKNMGQLFADMEPIDIQAEQAKIRIQKKEIDTERQEIQTQRQEIQTERQEIQTQRQEIQTERQEIQTERQEIQTERQEIQTQQQEIQIERQKLDAQKRELELMRQEILAEKEALITIRNQ